MSAAQHVGGAVRPLLRRVSDEPMRTSCAGRRAWLLMLAATGVALLLTACGGSEPSKPVAHRAQTDSINASLGALRLLAVRIETPEDAVHVEGDNVGLFLSIANTGSTADTLTAASTVDAQDILFRDGTARPSTGISVDIPAHGVSS